MNKVPYTLSEDSITVFWEGKPYTVRKDNANFQGLRQALFDARYDEVGDFLDIAKAVENFVEGEIEVKDEVVYYKGHRLHGVVVDKLLEMFPDRAPDRKFVLYRDKKAEEKMKDAKKDNFRLRVIVDMDSIKRVNISLAGAVSK